MNLQDKIEYEIQIIMNLIERYKQSNNPDAPSIIVAYEHGLKALMEVYEVSQRKEVIPF